MSTIYTLIVIAAMTGGTAHTITVAPLPSFDVCMDAMKTAIAELNAGGRLVAIKHSACLAGTRKS